MIRMHGLCAVYDMDVEIFVIIMTLMTPFIVEKDDGVVFRQSAHTCHSVLV